MISACESSLTVGVLLSDTNYASCWVLIFQLLSELEQCIVWDGWARRNDWIGRVPIFLVLCEGYCLCQSLRLVSWLRSMSLRSLARSPAGRRTSLPVTCELVEAQIVACTQGLCIFDQTEGLFYCRCRFKTIIYIQISAKKIWRLVSELFPVSFRSSI